MKKFILGLAFLCCSVGLTACQVRDKEQTERESFSKTDQSGIYEIAFMEEAEEEESIFYRNVWEGTAEYVKKNQITYHYYRPRENTEKAYGKAIEAAVKRGAKIIISKGEFFEKNIYRLQDEYPRVQFLLLDGEPKNEGGEKKGASNVHCILFKEEEAGYLAGYAAVCEGYTRLSVWGIEKDSKIDRYGYGFEQGAGAAAEKMDTRVELKYCYYNKSALDKDETKYEISEKMEHCFLSGIQIIFACDNRLMNLAAKAAEKREGKVMGVAIDLAQESEILLASTVKNYTDAIIMALEDLYNNGGMWPNERAGKTVTLGAKEEMLKLSGGEKIWRFDNFSKLDYWKIYRILKNEEINISITSVPGTDRVKIEGGE
ncbi:MAG: BMP family ABC transporter substrate-binding protein [Lachnospiraceae bacterium]|nr:BMP family ABC transporter substrate-binding protein [Lachnospiraceae bacterium]